MKENHTQPIALISDSDSTFTSNEFNKLISKYEINHETVPVGDHHSLGIIDRFALTLKRVLSKIRIKNDNPNWIDYLPKVINNYNNTPNESLGNLTPKQARLKENFKKVYEINYVKAEDNKALKNDLEPGDKVRLSEKGLFKKGSENQWSSETYTVDSTRGLTVYLVNGMKKKRDMLLKVSKDSVNITDLTKKISKERKKERILKKEDIDETNIRQSVRQRKKPEKLNL